MSSRSQWLSLGIVLICLLTAQPAAAYYDDVHYGLTYYIARQIGYTPEQAYRVASAAVSVDWSPETEPVQVSMRRENVFWMITPLSGVWQTATAQEPRWRFHAFRNEIALKDVVGDGADAAIGDAMIRAQHDLLWRNAAQLKNAGIFLHFFQDEVPHGGYGTYGGHWPVVSSELVQRHQAAGLPIGGSTDWLSFRTIDSNMALVQQTAAYLTEFLKIIAPKQKTYPLNMDNARRVVEALRQVNIAPEPLTGDAIDIFRRVKGLSGFPFTEWPEDGSLSFFANQLDLGPEEVRNIDRQMKGPLLAPAIEKINEALVREGVKAEPELPFETIPEKHRQYTFEKFGGLEKVAKFDAARYTELHSFVLTGDVTVEVSAPNPATRGKVVLKMAKTRPSDEEYVLGEGAITPGNPMTFEKLPIGEFIVELYDAAGKRVYNEKHQIVTMTRTLKLAMPAATAPADDNWVLRSWEGTMTCVSTSTNPIANSPNPVGQTREVSVQIKRENDGALMHYSSSFGTNMAPPAGTRYDKGTVRWEINDPRMPADWPKSFISLNYAGDTITGTYERAFQAAMWDKTVVKEVWKIEMRRVP